MEKRFNFSNTGCPRGSYGAGCKYRCGRCRDGVGCHHVTGYCVSGCEPGYTGQACNNGKMFILFRYIVFLQETNGALWMIMNAFVCFIRVFFVHFRFFHSKRDITRCCWNVTNLDLCMILRAVAVSFNPANGHAFEVDPKDPRI